MTGYLITIGWLGAAFAVGLAWWLYAKSEVISKGEAMRRIGWE